MVVHDISRLLLAFAESFLLGCDVGWLNEPLWYHSMDETKGIDRVPHVDIKHQRVNV